MMRTFIQTIALILIAESTVFFYRGSIFISVSDMAKASSTMWGHNTSVARLLSSQRADVFVGVFLLMMSLVFQLINMFWPMRWNDFAINWKGALLAFITALVVGSISWFWADAIRESSFKKVIGQLELNREAAMKVKNREESK